MDKELFSLLLICYNHEKYISDAIESVLAQKYDKIEVIICDDFSTDHSWNIIQSFRSRLEKKFERVIIFRNPHNIGLTSSLNEMLKKAAGAFVFPLSGDDMMAENYAADIMEAGLKYPTGSAFVTNGYWVDENEHYADLDISLLKPFYTQPPDLDKNTLFERLYWHNCIFAPGVSLRSNVYEKFGQYDTDICIEDLEYWLRISAAKETEFIYIDKKNVFYRKNPDSASSKVKNAQYVERWLRFMDASEKIIDKYAEYAGTTGYIERKWQFLLDELQFYKVYLPEKELKLLKGKLGPFIKANWTILGWKQLVMYYHIYVIIIFERIKNICNRRRK